MTVGAGEAFRYVVVHPGDHGLKEHPPNLNNFLLYLKHIYQIENNASTVKNKWEPMLPYISLLT